MTQEEKQAIMAEYATHEGDTGSPEVQILLFLPRESMTLQSISKHTKKIIIQEEVFLRWLVTDVIFLHICRRLILKDIVIL
jgi:hypothetical protein